MRGKGKSEGKGGERVKGMSEGKAGSDGGKEVSEEEKG